MHAIDENQIRRVEELVRRIEQIPDRATREIVEELMQSILALHGSGLERMMELTFETGPAGESLLRRFAGDHLVSSLLVLHGLHPDDLETRARQALARLPGHAEILGVFEGVVRVRANGPRDPIINLLRDALPDAVEVAVEETTQLNGFVPLAALGSFVSKAG